MRWSFYYYLMILKGLVKDFEIDFVNEVVKDI